MIVTDRVPTSWFPIGELWDNNHGHVFRITGYNTARYELIFQTVWDDVNGVLKPEERRTMRRDISILLQTWTRVKEPDFELTMALAAEAANG